MNKDEPSDWFALKPRSVITISDAQAIRDSMRRGQGVRGIDYTVRSVERCDHVDGLCTHLFLNLEDSEQSTVLLVKVVDGLVDLFLYFEPQDLAGGRREELLDRGMYWLFREPPNPERFEPMDLRYAPALSQRVASEAGDGATREVVYRMKSQGEIQSHHGETPARQGVASRLLATVVEYQAESPAENPEFLILEVGENRSRQSFVRFYQGCALMHSEVDVLALQPE